MNKIRPVIGMLFSLNQSTGWGSGSLPSGSSESVVPALSLPRLLLGADIGAPSLRLCEYVVMLYTSLLDINKGRVYQSFAHSRGRAHHSNDCVLKFSVIHNLLPGWSEDGPTNHVVRLDQEL